MFACADRPYMKLIVLLEAHECALTTFTMSKGCPTMTCVAEKVKTFMSLRVQLLTCAMPPAVPAAKSLMVLVDIFVVSWN